MLKKRRISDFKVLIFFKLNAKGFEFLKDGLIKVGSGGDEHTSVLDAVLKEHAGAHGQGESDGGGHGGGGRGAGPREDAVGLAEMGLAGGGVVVLELVDHDDQVLVLRAHLELALQEALEDLGGGGVGEVDGALLEDAEPLELGHLGVVDADAE